MIPIPGQPPMAPPMMGGAPPMGGMPPPEMMGLFGLISGLAKQPRMTPMDKMRKIIEDLENVREEDPEKTGINASMAIDILRNGPDSNDHWGHSND